MRIEKIWFDKDRIYALFDDGRTMWQSLLYYRNLMNAKNRDDYVIEDDGVHWYGLDEDISNESFEYEDPEPRGLSVVASGTESVCSCQAYGIAAESSGCIFKWQ